MLDKNQLDKAIRATTSLGLGKKVKVIATTKTGVIIALMTSINIYSQTVSVVAKVGIDNSPHVWDYNPNELEPNE